jgi:hypothetical protein
VAAKNNYIAPIREITVSQPDWGVRHWKSLVAAYARAPHFKRYEEPLSKLYLDPTPPRLSAINRRFIEAVCGFLGITTRLSWSMDYELAEGRTERLVGLCRQTGADFYISGPTARAYLDLECFQRAGIEVQFFDYSGYPEYEQLHPPFEHAVSVLDLLFHAGPDAPRYMLTF